MKPKAGKQRAPSRHLCPTLSQAVRGTYSKRVLGPEHPSTLMKCHLSAANFASSLTMEAC